MDSDSSTDRHVRSVTTGASPAPKVSCRKCGKSIDATSSFCPHCGRRQQSGDAWYYHPVWISVLALVVLGPFALFLVWKSSKMSLTVKLFMATWILAYTGLCSYFLYEVMVVELKQLSDFNNVLRQIK